jgi:guanine nucleotide-binding protein G(i) subunit alpha
MPVPAQSQTRSMPAKVEWPPQSPLEETDEEKAVRLEQEREAKRISDAIDHDIAVEREQRRRQQGPMAKVLLLGGLRAPYCPS